MVTTTQRRHLDTAELSNERCSKVVYRGKDRIDASDSLDKQHSNTHTPSCHPEPQHRDEKMLIYPLSATAEPAIPFNPQRYFP
jgi:hypothetical protein